MEKKKEVLKKTQNDSDALLIFVTGCGTGCLSITTEAVLLDYK